MASRGNPNKRYMLAIDAAHAAGMRDSLDFFRKNPLLVKTNCTRYEKEQFILEGRVHPNMKNKNIALVACRNAYKIMGAKFVKGGRYVIDDYYEQAAIRSGAVKGALALVQPYQSKREEAEDRPSGGGKKESSSLALIPKALQDTFADKEQRTQFGQASHIPFAKWDPAAKQRKPGPFTPESWALKYAQAINQHNKEIRRWREDQFVSVSLAPPQGSPAEQVKQEDGVNDGVGLVVQAPQQPQPDSEDVESPVRLPPSHPIGRLETHTNLPHVRQVTQPSSANFELLDVLPRISDDTEDPLSIRRAAERRGLYSVELVSTVVDLEGQSLEYEAVLENAGWPRLPGGWEFSFTP
jgi:hypothetical protein